MVPFDEDLGDQSSVAGSGASRRSFLRLAGVTGALGIAPEAFRALLAGSARRSFLGSNPFPFNEIRAGVPGLNGVRIYDTGRPDPSTKKNHLATKWPAGPYSGYKGPIVFSIYPVPDPVTGISTAGPNHDAVSQIQHLIDSAPPNSYLTAWHEALTLHYPSYVTSNSMFQLHARLNRMTRGTNVTYGSVFFAISDLDPLFRSVPRDLGFYGLDLYGNNGLSIGMERLEAFITKAKAKATRTATPGYPRLLIAECNSPIASRMFPHAAPRPEWFTAVCKRMHKYGTNSIGVLTYWNANGKLSGSWRPKDKATIGAMNDIIHNIF